ncbi:MAG: hypothetical protein ROR55_02915 [Devosia sp.]
MNHFQYIDDLVAWLQPMDYQGFWHAVAPHDLHLPSRRDCDRQIACGEAAEDVILGGLKYIARAELAARYGLEWRPATPWLKVVT